MHKLLFRALLTSVALYALVGNAIADDWTAVRLRGEVFVYRDGWIKLERGDVVSDDSIIRTLGHGRVSFQRDAETIDLMANSQIRIVDGTSRRFTTVMHDYGKVEIDAEVENVEHFAVATPFLAAVVKGTHFAVSSTPTSSAVEVSRGQVFVEDSASHESVTIVAGQTASTSSSGGELVVTGVANNPGGTTAGSPASNGDSAKQGENVTNVQPSDQPQPPTHDQPTPDQPTPQPPVVETPTPPQPPADNDNGHGHDHDDHGNHYGWENGNNGRGRDR